jgi:hypothetical protein
MRIGTRLALTDMAPRLVDQGRPLPQCRCWDYEPQGVRTVTHLTSNPKY